MIAEIGNNAAIAAERNPQTRQLEWSPLPGEHVTTIQFPDDIPLSEAVASARHALRRHMAPDTTPAWITSDNDDLQRLLLAAYDLPPEAGERPEGWGD